MRLIRIAALALSVIILVSSVACGSKSEQEITPITTLPQGFTAITDSTNGFSIFVPGSWNQQQTAEGSTLFLSTSNCELRSIAVTVTHQETSYSNAQEYYSEYFEDFFKDYDEYQLISKENLTLGGIPVVKVIFINNYTNLRMQEMHLFLVKGQTLWCVWGACATECWDLYEGTFDTILYSFHVLD